MEVSTPRSLAVDVSSLTEVIGSSSKIPLHQLRNPASQEYLSKLTTYGLDELLTEPTALQTHSHHLTSSLTSLTHTSYPTFLSLHHTTNALTTSLTSLSSSLDSLLTSSIPALEDCAAKWKDRTDSVLKERHKAQIVLEQHEKIRDLLEIPLLIDTCVRNGYFSEALSLVTHAQALAASPSISAKTPPLILSSVLSEVHYSIMQMLLSLLATLYEPNRKLPALWKAINFLRKMDVFGPSSPFTTTPSSLKSVIAPAVNAERSSHFITVDISSEEQIALAFLLGRESCLKLTLDGSGSDVLRMTRHGELDDREKEDLARYLKKYIDVWREGVYDIITQYSTIFLEKNSALSSAPPNQPIKANSTPSSDQEAMQLHTLITTYASRALTNHLLPILSPSLPLLSLPLLPSLLTQLTYCSSAFARVGLDFRGALSLLFSDAVAAVVSHEMKTTGDTFAFKFKLPPIPGNNQPKSKWENPSKWLISASAISSLPIPISPPLSVPLPPHVPPQILTSYPPLAGHTNDLLTVLNTLRLLAPSSILHMLASVLDEDVLSKGGAALLAYIKVFYSEVDLKEEVGGKEKEILMSVGRVYFSVLVPFMRRALVEGVYGTNLDSIPTHSSLAAVLRDWEEYVHQAGSEVDEGEGEEEEDGSS